MLEKIKNTQQLLKSVSLDGWLLYDFRKTNDLACQFLELPAEKMCTRRFFYWIPQHGTPVKIVHRIESQTLAHLPGTDVVYSTWEELEMNLRKVLNSTHKIAMEYSPRNAIPYVSKVDGGTIELIRSYGVEVVTSADLLQRYTSVWTPKQLEHHLKAADVLEKGVEKAWKFIANALNTGKKISESDVQQLLLQEFERNGCISEDPPICAVNEHSADPHYSPQVGSSAIIQPGDFVLIDLWSKLRVSHAVYADITKVGVAAGRPTKRQQEIFDIVKTARDAAMILIRERLQKGGEVRGWEVDQACRDVIARAGYGEYFTHRTGHNIGEKDHGNGANIDNFETKDNRLLLPGTCFSIEPGIYLPGEFGVRLEHDVFIEPDGKNCRVTGGLQTEIVCIVK